MRDFRPLERTTDLMLGAMAALAFTSTSLLNSAFTSVGLSLISQDLWIAAALLFGALALYIPISRLRRGMSHCETFTMGAALASVAAFLSPLALGGLTMEPWAPVWPLVLTSWLSLYLGWRRAARQSDFELESTGAALAIGGAIAALLLPDSKLWLTSMVHSEGSPASALLINGCLAGALAFLPGYVAYQLSVEDYRLSERIYTTRESMRLGYHEPPQALASEEWENRGRF